MKGDLLVRADASRSIGAGHFMRTLTLAAEWVRQGGRATMISADPPAALAARVASAGVALERAVAPAGSEADREHMLTLIGSRESDVPLWVALDGYDFGFAYQTSVREAGARLLVIDDTAHQPAYSADVILNQNAGAEELVYRANPDARLLMGPRFVLLRPEFRAVRDAPRPGAPAAHNLLVTFGGSDPANCTARVLRALREHGLTSFATRTVLGGSNAHRAEVSSEIALWEAGRSANGVTHLVLEDVQDMSTHMEWADLAIAAAGSTTWELASCGVPAVLVVTAGNQRRSAAAAQAGGVALSLGEWKDGRSEEQLATAIVQLAGDADARARMRERGRRLIDGRGAERVVDVLAGQQ